MGVTSNFVDFAKYENIKDPKAIDYSKLTQIESTDQYKVVSVKETIIKQDENGKVTQKIQNIQSLEDDEKSKEPQMQTKIVSAASSMSSNNSQKPLVSNEDNLEKAMPHQTIDIDNLMKKTQNVNKYEQDDDE